LELFDLLNKNLNIDLRYKKIPVRESDQKVFIANFEKATKFLDWNPKVSAENGVAQTVDWVKRNC
jgi:CDP-paratose 2-epimerase